MPASPSAPTNAPPATAQLVQGWRDPDALLARTRAEWGGSAQALWLFAYASLLWKREFDVVEHRPARVAGWHRAFRMRSRVNRGTPETPGLVYALMAGGSCRGTVFRVPPEQADDTLRQLWLREMPTGVYEPRWLKCQTAAGSVSALAFTLNRGHPAHTGRLSDEAMLGVLRHARGRYGSTLDYLLRTGEALAQLGIHDQETQRLIRLARSHGLHGPVTGPARR